MWPKWLADTLDRSSPGARPHAAAARRQHVAGFAIPSVDDSRIGARADDWDLVTGFRIHEGFGRVAAAETEAAGTETIES